jgi:hypothetical protein
MTATTEERTEDGMLFTGTETVSATIAEYGARLDAVRERYDAYHPDVASRRYVADSYHDAARNVRSASGWLAGDNDRSYAGPHPSFGSSLLDFQVHYATDALRSALHFLLWAEHYAGLRDEDSVRAADPWNRH